MKKKAVICWSCSFSLWTESNLNMLSRKLQFSYRCLEVVPCYWDGQHTGNPATWKITWKIRPEMKHQEPCSVGGKQTNKQASNKHVIEGSYCTVFILLVYFRSLVFITVQLLSQADVWRTFDAWTSWMLEWHFWTPSAVEIRAQSPKHNFQLLLQEVKHCHEIT